jgi:hypothetical protein
MFIQGHIEIIQDILDNHLPKNFFKFIDDPIDKKLLKNLYIGLQYPDAPCGKYEISSNHSILFKRAKICEITKLFKLFSGATYGESKIFQFHKGYFAHLHSMSTDPENTVLKIRNKIINSIIGYALLAVYDDTLLNTDRQIKPNLFWIGIILHMITDSYSPAHTIRDRNYIKVKPVEKDKALLERLEVHELIKTLAKQDKLYEKQEFIESLLNLSNHKMYIRVHKSQFWKIYKVFKFEYDINKVIKKEFDTNKSLHKSYKEQEGDIISFQYYDSQNILAHAQYDLLSYVKDKPHVYHRMITECKALLILYKTAIETKNTPKFIKDLVKLLLNGTYRISKENLKHKTDIITNYF